MNKRYSLVIAAALLSVGSARDVSAKDGDVIRRGALVAIDDSSVTVGDLTCSVSSDTEFENQQEQRVSRSAFSVGDIVKLVCRGSSAHSVEMENDLGGGGSDHDSKKEPRKDSGKSSSKDKRIKARLQAPEVLNTSASGNLDFRLKLNGSTRDDRLTIGVKIPLSSTVPAAVDQTDAQSLALRAVFYRAGVAYAACTLVYDVSAGLRNPTIAQYKVDVRAKGKKSNPKLKAAKGSCVVNLDTEAEQLGLPALEKGDSVNVEEATAGEFLGVVVR